MGELQKAAKPVTAFQDCIATFLSVRSLDIFKETFWLFPGVFVVTKTSGLNQIIIFS